MTCRIIEFPQTKDPLDFAGMGIKIDVEKQRESWDAAFTSVQTALRFCNFDRMEAEKAVREFGTDGLVEALGSDWAESIDYLEAVVATMKAAVVRLATCEDRVLARLK